MTSQQDPMIGRLIDGRYEVRSRIARGGMATVYLATDLRLERRVAIKIMHGHLSDDSNFRNRFVQEARSAARLAHPNVVSVFDQGQDSDMAYLVMEYLPGITLRDLLKDYGKLTAEQTIDIMDAVLSGLAAAHKAGIVHRDLKPENVLLADDGRIKIGDFGLARAASANTATGQALLGTIAYLSPELVTRGIADARSDIYAIGIMMYEVLTGEQPFQGEQPMQIAYQHANDSVPTPSSKNSSVGAEFDELVLWATARDPDDRPKDARVMLDGLREVEKGFDRPVSPDADLAQTMVLGAGGTSAQTQVLGASRRRDTAPQPPSGTVATLTTAAKKRKARGWWLFVLILLLAAGAGGTGWYFGSGPGANVTIPSLTGQTTAAATTALHKLGFVVAPVDRADGIFTLTVKDGLVVATTPKAGKQMLKGSTITLRVSLGAKPITLKQLAGLKLKDAEAEIRGKGAVVGPIVKQFDPKIAKDIVISAAKDGGGKNADLSKGGAYFVGSKVDLVVSDGPIPNVSGMTVSDATNALENVGLHVQPGPATYSDTVPNGNVIAAQQQNSGPVHPGDTLALETSKGPKPVPVPPVVGQTWDKAKPALEKAGFKVKYSPPAGWTDDAVKSHPQYFTVTALDPAANTPEQKGTTVTATLQFTFPG